MGEIVQTIISATQEKVFATTPKGSEIVSFEDDGCTLTIVYNYKGKPYFTKVASTGSTNYKRQRRRNG